VPPLYTHTDDVEVATVLAGLAGTENWRSCFDAVCRRRGTCMNGEGLTCRWESPLRDDVLFEIGLHHRAFRRYAADRGWYPGRGIPRESFGFETYSNQFETDDQDDDEIVVVKKSF